MSNRTTQKLTKRSVDALQPKPGSDYSVWDSEVMGFGVRIKESGVKSFVIKYRNQQRRQRKTTLGRYGVLTVEQARRMARSELGKAATGDDPAAERKATRNAQTVATLCDCYLRDAMAGKVLYRGKQKKPETLRIDRGRIERHIKPLLGHRRIDEVTRNDVEQFMFAIRDGATACTVKTAPRGVARVRGGQGTAVMAVKLLSAIYNFAIRKDLAEANPCQFVEKPADNKRQRFLSTEEYARLGRALLQAASDGINPLALIAIRVLTLTGCRRGEILNLKRDEVDIEGRCLRLGETKTGPQLRPCGRASLDLLTDVLKFHGSDWVFPSARRIGPLVNIRQPMMKVCSQAELRDVTPHSLRHSFATVAHELGYSELTIAGLLGHRAGTVTSRYAHHVDHVLSNAADLVSKKIAERINVS